MLFFWLGSLKSPLLLLTDAMEECEDERCTVQTVTLKIFTHASSRPCATPDLRSNPKECG
jgi:hypothetical protein